jgi:DNA modification methylase
MQHNLFSEVEITTVSPAIAKPFVSRSTFYQGDCLIEMDKIADKSVDMILCDLPYGTTACKWDNIIPFDKMWQQYERIIKDNGAIVLTASQPFTSALVMSNPKLFKYEWIWEKSKASNFLQASYMPLKAHENIMVFSKNKANYNAQKTVGKPFNKGKDKRDGIATEVYQSIPNINGFKIINESGLRNPRTVQYFTTAESEGKFHPTQKPIELMAYLIKTYTNEGEIVLDNCMGSGTTGVACKKTGRHFIGIEKDEKYFELAVSRVYAYCG